MEAMKRTASRAYGPFTSVGLAAAILAALVDQATKLWLIDVYRLGARHVVPVAPVLDLHLIWNSGISYGLFQQESPEWQWVLLGVKVLAVALLWIWLAHARTRLTAVSLGLIIGGAIGNGIDRLAYGAVVDFALFHIEIGGTVYNWYIFNLADVAIVAGVAGLLYDSFFGAHAAKAP